MSSHLRHCPKHRKPLPCAHCALTAKPAPAAVSVAEPDASPAPAATVEATKKRGRPKKEDALTPVERKRAQRNRQAVDQALADNKDGKGRLHNERSGEANRKFGMSEIERIVAATERDENGRRISPTGQGPARFERDETEDRTDARPPSVPGNEKWREEQREKQRKEDEKLTRIAVWAFNDKTFCRLCGFTARSAGEAVGHIEDAWDTGLKLQQHYDLLSEPGMSKTVPESMLNEARRRVNEDSHFRALSLVRRER
jgi:hypothetical protein